MHPPPAPPPIDPSELRPRRRWYVVASVIGVILVLAGIGGFAYGVVTAATQGGLTKKFAPGHTVTVRLAPESRPAIYMSGGDRAMRTRCQVTSNAGEKVQLSSPRYSFTYTRQGTTWEVLWLIDVTTAGQYRVLCTTSATSEMMFALGTEPQMGRFFAGLFGGLLSLFVLPTIGILVAGITVLVVAIRRGNHKRSLQAARQGPSHAPHPYPHPPRPGPPAGT